MAVATAFVGGVTVLRWSWGLLDLLPAQSRHPGDAAPLTHRTAPPAPGAGGGGRILGRIHRWHGQARRGRWHSTRRDYHRNPGARPGGGRASLGIELDSFIGNFETFVVGLGLAVGLVGLTGWVGSLMDNPFATFSGQRGLFRKPGCSGVGPRCWAWSGSSGVQHCDHNTRAPQ